MSPRVIQMPLSGGDRKHFKKSLDAARRTYEVKSQREAVARRDGEKMLRAAQVRLQEADKLKCEAWNAIMFCGGPAVPSPTISQAINGGYPLLRVKCNGCITERRIELQSLKRPRDSQIHLIEAALFCEACSQGRRKQRAHIIWLEADTPADNQAS